MKNLIILICSALLTMASRTPQMIITGSVYDTLGNTISGVCVTEKGTINNTLSDTNGAYELTAKRDNATLIFSKIGFISQEKKVNSNLEINVILQEEVNQLNEDIVIGLKKSVKTMNNSLGAESRVATSTYEEFLIADYPLALREFNTEDYSTIHENEFRKVNDAPLSTFSIDVDAASYCNMRRFLNHGQMPPKDAVRIEEMINYFSYEYKEPIGEHPFSINTEVSNSPWNKENLLVQIGVQAKKLDTENLPPSNLVFLLDVSGSMNEANKLPLLKSSLKMLVNKLRLQDKVSIVVYAGAAGIVLPPTSGSNKQVILSSLQNLEAGGSTAGGEGIVLAYKIASEQFIKEGNNRIILATDGDFNIGPSSNAAMERLIEEKRNQGVFLSVLGFGMGNYKDSKMEILADKGNGNYAYIDNILEAKKVLVDEFGGTLFTIANDVKIQVEFNPSIVQAYRLIGYENRALKAEDFNNDKKDAGELGSGHTVTALYEIIPAGVKSTVTEHVDPLKYQRTDTTNVNNSSNELMTVKFRYKEPGSHTSKLITHVIDNEISEKMSTNLSWSAAVAGFGMLMRDSKFKGELQYKDVVTLALHGKGSDQFGYRKEFIDLVDIAGRISQ